jgi:hypothetical protein
MDQLGRENKAIFKHNLDKLKNSSLLNIREKKGEF